MATGKVRVAFLCVACFAPLTMAGEPPTWVIPRLEGEVRADGVLSEPQYSQAFHWDSFVEVEPRDNAKPSWHTEVWLFSNNRGLVVGVRAHDPNPKEVRTVRFRRDEVSGRRTDIVSLAVDPTGEAKQAVGVDITPMNDVSDFMWDLNVGEKNTDFDLIFEHGARLTNGGWEAEVVLPFSSLSFSPRKESRFLVSLKRIVPRGDEVTLSWLPVSRASQDRREGMAYVVVDTQGVHPARPFHIIPTWVGSRITAQDGGRESFGQGSFGITGEWQVRQDTLIKGTFRPDFSQVEADDTYQKINNRYPVYIPEKRPFFLEGAESFATALQLFYSRNIVQPEWGLKLSHRGEKLGFFAVLAQEENVPAARFGLSGSEATTTWAVFRSTWALDQAGSFVGATGTLRAFGDRGRNGVLSVDGIKRGENFEFQFQLAGSETTDTGRSEKGTAVDVQGSYRWSEYWSTSVGFSWIAPAFRADSGFVVRTDRQSLSLEQSYIYRPKEKTRLIRQAYGSFFFRNEETTRGELVWRGLSFLGGLTLPNQFALQINATSGREGIMGQDFPGLYFFSLAAFWGEHPLFRPWVYVLTGRSVVYGTSPWVGGSGGWGAVITSMVGAFTAELERSSFSFGDDVRQQDSWQASVSYVWSEEWSAKLFLVQDRLRLADLGWDSDSLFLNALLTYRINPFSAVYLGGNVAVKKEQQLSAFQREDARKQQLFLKVSWYF